MLSKTAAFIFGSLMGSFLNVCIYRMPEGKSVVWPGSHCPHCEKRIPWYDNIPFVSYLLLDGRCRFCRMRIPLRYLIVELSTALMFVVLLNHYRLTYDLFFYLVLVCLLIIATFVDIKHRIIPDEISLGGIILGFLLSSVKGFGLRPFIYDPQYSLDSFLGMLSGGGIIYLIGFLFDAFYFKLLKKPPIQGLTKSMGGGDVKLLAMIGAFLGWKKVIFTFFLAPFLGIIIGIINRIVKKDHTLAYGPFLSLAAILSLFWLDKIMRIIFMPWR